MLPEPANVTVPVDVLVENVPELDKVAPLARVSVPPDAIERVPAFVREVVVKEPLVPKVKLFPALMVILFGGVVVAVASFTVTALLMVTVLPEAGINPPNQGAFNVVLFQSPLPVLI